MLKDIKEYTPEEIIKEGQKNILDAILTGNLNNAVVSLVHLAYLNGFENGITEGEKRQSFLAPKGVPALDEFGYSYDQRRFVVRYGNTWADHSIYDNAKQEFVSKNLWKRPMATDEARRLNFEGKYFPYNQ